MRAFRPDGKRRFLAAAPSVTTSGLPLLDSAFTECEREDSTSILCLLRQIALKARQKQPVPFYSIRTVARRFDVPLATVVRIYAQLKKEGVLGSLWGSSTVVEPDELNKQLRIRGVVALPVSLKAFCAVRNYRMLFEKMHTALWKSGFASRQRFYEDGDSVKPAFIETLVNDKVDAVLWFLPATAELASIKRLLDRGVRVVSVVDSLILDRRTDYLLSRLRALKEVVNLWQMKGIRFVTILSNPTPVTPIRLDALKRCLDEVRMAHTVASVSPWPVGQARALCRQNNAALIFPSFESALQLAYEHADDFALLLRQRPVLLMEGMPDVPINISSCSCVEAIEFHWRPLVNRLASDLSKWKKLPKGQPIIFHAQRIQPYAKGYAVAA
jgi:hypothetical protein